jgi:uncharacterized membrane protein
MPCETAITRAREWTFWNTVRTVAPVVSAVLFTVALL